MRTVDQRRTPDGSALQYSDVFAAVTVDRVWICLLWTFCQKDAHIGQYNTHNQNERRTDCVLFQLSYSGTVFSGLEWEKRPRCTQDVAGSNFGRTVQNSLQGVRSGLMLPLL